MDADSIDLLRKTVRGVLGDDGRDPVDLLRELGWADIAAEAPLAMAAILFEEQGRMLVRSRSLDLVVGSALGGVAQGCAVAYPEPGVTGASSSVEPDRLVVRGFRWTGEDARTVVPARHGDELVVAIVDSDRLDVVPTDTFDPDLGLERVTGAISLTDVEVLEEVRWEDGLAAGRHAIACELVGLSSSMLEVCAAYVTERRQFGRPIGSFQAVQHQLADAHASVASARAVNGVAATGGEPVWCDIAKAVAGRASFRTGRACTQVSGAIGCTWEYDLHRFVRRALALDSVLGSWQVLRGALGTQIAATQRALRVGVAPGSVR